MDHYKHIGLVANGEEIRRRVNDRFENLFKIQNSGKYIPYVCTFCDEVLFHQNEIQYLKFDDLKKNQTLLSWSTHHSHCVRIPELEACFVFNDVIDAKYGDCSWVRRLAMSPRGSFGRKKEDNRSPYGFSCCNTCKHSILRGVTPLYAIVNQNHVGHAPSVLEDLTPLELSLVSPVKGYGYCFSYVGGANMNLKGTMTFMRVKETSIARGTAQLISMGLQNTVVVLLSGKMTPEQKLAASRSIRVDKVVAAVEWLCCNNRDWRDIDFDKFMQDLEGCTPCIVDRSSSVASENTNVESREVFSCYFPEEGMDEQRGVFENNEAFKAYVEDMQRKNYDLNLKVDLASEYVKGNESDYLSRACLLQFPYGVGGVNERRINEDESYSESVDMEKYLQHLTKLSQPVFQKPMFQLIAYSLICKVRLLKQSRLQVRGEHSANALANDLNQQDLRDAIRAKQLGDPNGGTEASKLLLKAVDACSKSLPHSNEAAKAARSTGESLQHHFGTGSIWLTVSFDDENGLLMQVLSDNLIDDDTEPSCLTAEELCRRKEARRKLRLNFPGFGAMHFEMLLHIVAEEVIGWDMRRNVSTGKVGLFGYCVALAIAMEEQGRTSVHGHMTAIIKGVRTLQREMFFGTFDERKKATDILSSYHAHIVSTSLFSENVLTMKNCLDHTCTVSTLKDRNMPAVVSDQCLRNLRHKLGYVECRGKFAYCKHCEQNWTYEEMVESYVRHYLQMDKLYVENSERRRNEENQPGSIPRARLLAEIVQYQKKSGFHGSDVTEVCINAVYNHHFSFHTKGCFKCNKKDKKKHTCGPTCECRMRYPDRSRDKCTIKYHHVGKPWFKWDGSECIQPIVEIMPKRNTYDLFQNTSCKAISESKMACNTNAAVITDGPIGQYQFKYQHKSTQKDDTAEYDLVDKAMKNLCDRKYDDDKREAVRLVCRAAFAHNSKNVIGSPLASYLVRNGSRFYFSHKFEYCPLRDLRRLLREQTVTSVVKFGKGGDVFFENMALHYLCRPDALEGLSPKSFYENYDTVRVSSLPKKRKHGEPDLKYKPTTGFFQHCSARTYKNGKIGPVKQSARKRTERAYVKVSQWEFPDTGSFNAEILYCNEDEMCTSMEKYCEVALCLLMPYRKQLDFTPKSGFHKYPCIKRFRELHYEDSMRTMRQEVPIMFTEENITFLQNIQDAGYNSIRYKISEDDLQSRTHAFARTEDYTVVSDCDSDDDSVDDESDFMYEAFLQELLDKSTSDNDSSVLPAELQNFSFHAMRNKGRGKSGYIEELPIPRLADNTVIRNTVGLKRDIVSAEKNSTHSTVHAGSDSERVEIQYRVRNIVELLLTKSVPSARKQVFKYNPDAVVSDANGSVQSILQWADAAKLDNLQRRAFEIIVCSFLYTFFDTAVEDSTVSLDIRQKHRKHLKTLIKLIGCNKGQIIALMLGPGGSGKSTVINLVVAYAREYCENLGHPYTCRTIVVTAMSGIAATLLHGETTHKALGLNRTTIPGTMIDEWWDTRLLIVDEISFASARDIDRIQRNCGILKGKTFERYGKLNVVFCGDFSQLEPVGRLPIYRERSCVAFHQYLNVFIELDGHHRFKDDVAWGNVMKRFRDGTPTLDDVRTINMECKVSATRVPPPGAQVATFYNRDRDAINCAIFERYTQQFKLHDNEVLQEAVLVFMDNLEMRDSKSTFARVNSNAMKKWFYSHCGEDSCKMDEHQGGRVDPVLKLYRDCPLMLTQNKDVLSGQANGSRVYLQMIHIKAGERPFHLRLKEGNVVRAYFASQVKTLEVVHESKDIIPNVFHVEKEQFTFKCRVDSEFDKREVQMRGHHFALISNSATTGHKLQGYTASNLLVADWMYSGNWSYTVLSRVRTMNGLYIVKPLSEDLTKYEMPDEVEDMLMTLRNALPVEFFDERQYYIFCSDTA